MTQQTQIQKWLDALKNEINDIDNYSYDISLRDMKTAQLLLQTEPALQIATILTILDNWSKPTHYSDWKVKNVEIKLVSQLCKRQLPYTIEDIQMILLQLERYNSVRYYLLQTFLRAISSRLKDPQLLADCRPYLESLRSTLSKASPSAELRRHITFLNELLGGQPEYVLTIHDDAWGTQVTPLLDAMEEDTRVHWNALLYHCSAANSTTPNQKWLTEARKRLASLGRDTVVMLLREWIGSFSKRDDERLAEENATLLKGLAWLSADFEDERLATILGDAAIEGYRKLAGLGPRAPKVANACVYALKEMPSLHGAAQLERVRLNTKQASLLKGIETALNEAAQRTGMSREDLEELTVPTFAFTKRRRTIAIGDATVELSLHGANVQLRWFNAAGRPCKAAPAEVKREHKQALKELKRLSDDIAHLLTAQRLRLERLPLLERSWSLSAWGERYLDHPLLSTLTHALIWRFTIGEQVLTGIWHEGHVVDAQDQPISLPEDAVVSMWHPIFSSAQEVLAWRLWLEKHQITQPFKQAHREVYLLTEAERTTALYSNRFAAHILRQHQFNALAIARGWRNTLRLMIDDAYQPATLELPHWGLRAEFWIEGVGETHGVDATDAGTYFYLTTDQVRFYQIDAEKNYAHACGGGYYPASGRIAADPLSLETISALVFSEVMRDVDLFVGVTSVGNDAEWQDGGPQGRHRLYWESYTVGHLSATAETRKQLLERLIPKLSLAQRCSIDGRFLKVHGDLRTYKIHLGSGSILMEPNDQYLCIVPGKNVATTGNFFLPFEGDTMLVIILSKAFLLAEDTRITDPTITNQIGR